MCSHIACLSPGVSSSGPNKHFPIWFSFMSFYHRFIVMHWSWCGSGSGWKIVLLLHCLLLDFSKTFDCSPQEVVAETDALGIRGRLVASICGFLTCWAQRVVINGIYSSLDLAFPRELSLVPCCWSFMSMTSINLSICITPNMGCLLRTWLYTRYFGWLHCYRVVFQSFLLVWMMATSIELG